MSWCFVRLERPEHLAVDHMLTLRSSLTFVVKLKVISSSWL